MAGRAQFVVGVTGASGAAYARRLIERLAAADADVHVIFSPHGRQLFADELDLRDLTPQRLGGGHAERIALYAFNDVSGRLASGSFLTNGMVVCPASTNTLAHIAAGTASNLITRAAHVHLKESRRLVVVPREAPLSRIEIENMLRIAQAGGIVCPASPGFYLRPRNLDDLVDFLVGKLLDLLGVPHALSVRWEGSPAGPGGS